MSEYDPELRALLILELEKHAKALEASPPSLAAAGRAVHALKGAAGLANERELANALQRLERRFREDDVAAVADAAALVNPMGNAAKNAFALASAAGGAQHYVPMLATWVGRANGIEGERSEALKAER